MDAFRTRSYIPWNKIENWLRASRSIWISTTRPDGRPHAVPLWFIWDDHKVYFISARDLQKSKNLAHQSWTVVHLGDGDDVVILQGPAQIVTEREELERSEEHTSELQSQSNL